MTTALYRTEPYCRGATARVVGSDDAAVRLDATLFYPRGGGQPGDSGRLAWDGGVFDVADTVRTEAGIVLLGSGQRPHAGAEVAQSLDWDRRYSHMRVHTALHLLSVVIPLPVTGGQISAGKGRLDFDMPDAPADRDALQSRLSDLVAADLPVSEDWITETELAANPGLVKTMSVRPPSGAGRVRLIRIGAGDAQVDLQPCGGTHVARTGEVGEVRL